MPLITNRCKKHGRAYVEDECPQCARETLAHNINQTQAFFDQNGNKRIELTPGRFVRLEDLYQYFRIRLLDEINERE